jgi:hypothetical protein
MCKNGFEWIRKGKMAPKWIKKVQKYDCHRLFKNAQYLERAFGCFD